MNLEFQQDNYLNQISGALIRQDTVHCEETNSFSLNLQDFWWKNRKFVNENLLCLDFALQINNNRIPLTKYNQTSARVHSSAQRKTVSPSAMCLLTVQVVLHKGDFFANSFWRHIIKVILKLVDWEIIHEMRLILFSMKYC